MAEICLYVGLAGALVASVLYVRDGVRRACGATAPERPALRRSGAERTYDATGERRHSAQYPTVATGADQKAEHCHEGSRDGRR